MNNNLPKKELVKNTKNKVPIHLPFEDDMLPPWATNQISVVRNVWLHKDEIWINYERHHGSGTNKKIIDINTLNKILQGKTVRLNN